MEQTAGIADIDPVPSVTGATSPIPMRERPPAHVAGPLAWARANLFNAWWSTALTLVLGYLVLRGAWGLFRWGVLNAVWAVPQGASGPDTSVCRALQGAGACWAVIGEKYRFILFGFYPYDQQWRPTVCLLLFVGLFIVSANRRFWRKELLLVWVATLVVIGVLMWGGVLGLPFVPQDQWSGLPITLALATFGLALAFPLAVLVALGRRSRNLPAVKMVCVVYVEFIRGVPLIAILFMASVMVPLFLPAGFDINKLLRAQLAFVLFAGAYLAEIVRGGLQALPKGQAEAADALGLSYWKKTMLITLPQALRLVIPPLVNTFIGFFKDTSLVLIVGIFDLMKDGSAAILEPAWQGFGNEVYIFLAGIYFIFCFAMSKYSRGLERDFSRSKRR
jgi:general L-amino acid transport system permease protein